MCLKSYFRCYLHYYFAFKTSIVKPQSCDVNTPEVKDALYGQMLKITFLNVKVAQVGLRCVEYPKLCDFSMAQCSFRAVRLPSPYISSEQRHWEL